MAFNVASLANYTKENEKKLLFSSVLAPKTAALIKAAGNVQIGIKSSEQLGIMDTDAIFQDGASCGFTASGTTTISQRPLVVGKVKINETLCQIDLERVYLQKALPEGSTYTELVFAADYSARKGQKIADQLETATWQGDTTSGSALLNKFDGFLKHITTAGASVVNANTTTYIAGAPITSITAANVVSIFDAVYSAIPAKVVGADDMTIFCGMDVFRLYTIALKNANLFHYKVDVKADAEFYLPGTSVKVVATPGLNGTNDIVASRISNLFIGTDMLDEQDKFNIFYDQSDDVVKYVARFKYGCQIAFPDEVVKFIV